MYFSRHKYMQFCEKKKQYKTKIATNLIVWVKDKHQINMRLVL